MCGGIAGALQFRAGGGREHPRELALVRCADGARAIATAPANGGKELRRIGFEYRQRVGIEDAGGGRVEAGQYLLPCLAGEAAAGADDECVAAACRRAGWRGRRHCRSGASMIAVRCAALTASAVAGLATVTRPAPARSAARAASRAAPVAGQSAGDDDRVAAPVFVRVDRQRRRTPLPELRSIAEARSCACRPAPARGCRSARP